MQVAFRLLRLLKINLTGRSAGTLMLSYIICPRQLDGANNHRELVRDIDDK